MDDRRKNYRVWDAQQNCHASISPRDGLPEDDLVFFLLDLIPQIDLTPFTNIMPRRCAANPRGSPSQNRGHDGRFPNSGEYRQRRQRARCLKWSRLKSGRTSRRTEWHSVPHQKRGSSQDHASSLRRWTPG